MSVTPRMAPPEAHQHEGCKREHPKQWCRCHAPKAYECQKCSRDRFNTAMALKYAEDRLTTEELLERRA
jgi:hypothetical protein